MSNSVRINERVTAIARTKSGKGREMIAMTEACALKKELLLRPYPDLTRLNPDLEFCFRICPRAEAEARHVCRVKGLIGLQCRFFAATDIGVRKEA